jgi:hypothetical protein
VRLHSGREGKDADPLNAAIIDSWNSGLPTIPCRLNPKPSKRNAPPPWFVFVQHRFTYVFSRSHRGAGRRDYPQMNNAASPPAPDHLPQMQGVVMLGPAIDGPSSDPDRLTVVKIVDVAASKRQGVAPSRKAKLLNLQGNLKGVFTGDPLSPRQFSASSEKALFSSTYVSISCGRPVEACWPLLKPGALGSYKIIYSGSSGHYCPLVTCTGFARALAKDS